MSKSISSRGKEPEHRAVVRANIRNRRIELGIPQRELAETIGVVYQFIQKIESHNPGCFKESPSIERLWTIAEALGCSPHDLLIPGRFKGPPEDEDLRNHRVDAHRL
jgi:transcriptional regulator with XRE-family HTH domain